MAAPRREDLSGPPSVSPPQVTTFRLRRHHLLERAATRERFSVLREIGGAQAQVLSAAELSLATRVRGLTPQAFDGMLWRTRTLARAWCMRRTLHLLPSRDLATFVRGTAGRAEKEVRWALGRGVDPARLESLLASTLAVLDRPATVPELAERVAREARLPLATWTGGGWGNDRKIPSVRLGPQLFPATYLLHLVGARGVICSGPPRGAIATYVRADAWVPGFRDVRPQDAEDSLLRTYLAAYGPAGVRDFVAWSRVLHREASTIFARLTDELAPVRVGGARQWVLKKDLGTLLEGGAPPPSLRLLPNFDVFLLGHMSRDHILPSEHLPRVSRPQGWVSPVLLIDGRVWAVWSSSLKGEELQVRLEPLRRIPRASLPALRREAGEVARFLGAERFRLSGV